MKRLFYQSQKTKGIPTKQGLQINSPVQQLSDEQRLYVQQDFNPLQDTILIAKAGGGKTFCILERMKYLAQNEYLLKDQMMIFSFSKLTIENTKNSCKKYNDATLFSDDKLIMTIDSFCYQVIHKIELERESCDVNVLSAKFHDMISGDKESQVQSYLRRSRFRKIKALFIDEAQDLNQIQYDIILYLKRVIKCSLHFIGDPNQNIYQFNGSFERFMLNHPGQRFNLTKNFRSSSQIEQFSKYFEYHSDQADIQTDVDMEQDSSKNGIQICVQSQSINDNNIVNIIKQLQKEGHSLRNIAFISPIVGDQFNTGIKRIANILDKNGIPYTAYYAETNDTNKKNKNTNLKQSVNLLTIHGSKGLEYNVVILLRFCDKMMISENYEHSNFVAQNMNLIYVALTRAKQKLIIIHDDQQNILQKHICSLIQRVPSHLYQVTGDIQRHITTIQNKLNLRQKLVDESCEFVQNNQVNDVKEMMLISKYALPELYELNIKEGMFQNVNYLGRTGVNKFIQGIDKKSLLYLTENLLYKKKCTELYSVSDTDTKLFKELRHEKEALIGILLEQLFFYQIQSHKQLIAQIGSPSQMPKILKILFTIKDTLNDLKITQFFVISSIEQFNQLIQLLYSIKVDASLTQQQLDEIICQYSKSTISNKVYDQIYEGVQQNLIEYLDFGSISLQQIQTLNDNKEYIFQAINQYNQGIHWSQSIESIIYICTIKYAIKSKHCKYIMYNQGLIDSLKNFDNLFKQLDTFAETLKNQIVIYQKEIDNRDIIGFIDFVVIDPETKETTIVEFKTTNDLAIEHILQIIIYDYILQQTQETDSNNRLIIINALKGVQYEIKVEQKDQMFEFLTKLLQQDQFQRNNAV